MASFSARIQEIRDRVGKGTVEGIVEVNQIYAAAIERGYWVSGPLAGHTNHPRHGGETEFLKNSLDDFRDAYIQRLADHALEEHGLVGAMVDNVEHLSGQVAARAPVELGDLRASAHPTVEDDGAVVYDRAPAVRRLSADELKAKSKLAARARDTLRRTLP